MRGKVALEHSSKSTKYELEGSCGDPFYEHFRFGIHSEEVETVYFKEPQIKEHPEIHELVHSIMMAGSKCKQELSRKNGEDLLDKVNEFAKIFWATKNVETQIKKAPYLPGLDIVCPVLMDA